MQEVSTKFYESLEPFSVVDDFSAANEALDRTTGKNHLRYDVEIFFWNLYEHFKEVVYYFSFSQLF